jgi:hypothetical protein
MLVYFMCGYYFQQCDIGQQLEMLQKLTQVCCSPRLKSNFMSFYFASGE